MPPLGFSRIPPELLPSLIERYQAGENLKDLAKTAGVSYQTVGRALQKAGVQLRGRQKTPATRKLMSESRRFYLDEERLRYFQSHQLTCREMAEMLGCNEETVRQRLIELELPRLEAKAHPERNYFWRGGYSVDEDGYILVRIPDHPHATSSGYVRQHRLMMEHFLGRYLLPDEVVDHRNGDTSDNRVENLRLYSSNAAHLRDTLIGKRNLPPEERERLRLEAVRRARQRVAAILAESGIGDDRWQ
jgi:hypothetical protein